MNDRYVNSIYYFDKNGNKLDKSLIDSTLNLNFSYGISLKGTDSFTIPVVDNNDIYLKRYTNFTVLDSFKVNDDQSGSNQLNSFLTKVNDNKYLSGWQEDAGLKGRFIDINGNVLSDIIDLPGYSIKYFKDGYSVALWKSKSDDSYFTLGFSILDPNQNIVCNSNLLNSDDISILSAEAEILSDSLFVIIYENHTLTKLTSFNRNGYRVKDYNLSAYYSYAPHIYSEGKDSIWVAWDGKLQLFSNQLKPISQTYSMYPTMFLGNNKFFLISGNNPYSYKGLIVDPSMDTIKNNIPLVYQADEINVSNLTVDKFIVLYRTSNKLYEKTFTNNGNLILDSTQIDDGVTSFKKLPCVSATESKVMFTWSDARNEGNGYDIYGSIYDITKITSVKKSNNLPPSSFSLSQNYPNPFNPSTRIKYSVPSTANGNMNVQIKVYDILGKEISTLVNETKPAGTYELEFNTQSNNKYKNLSSGIYFYQMKAGSFVETRKFILLK
jgi:hypothetical protein